MKRRETIHYGKKLPVCRIRSKRTLPVSTDKRRVTCDNCSKTHTFREGLYLGGED